MQPEDIFNQLHQHNQNLALKIRVEQMSGQISALKAELAAMQENCHAINDAAGVLRRDNEKLLDAAKRLSDLVEWLGANGKLPPEAHAEASEAVTQFNNAI